jgi:hypothetical protein
VGDSLPFAAQGEDDLRPVAPHLHVDEDERRQQGEGEKNRRSQVGHELSP